MTACKIIVKDEVNCKLEGLEVEDRRNLVKMFSYEIPGARYLPAVRLGRWDGKVSYFQLGGTTFVNLLSDIIPYLESRGYDIELDDIRTYNTNFQFTLLSEDSFAHKTWPEGHPIAGQPIMFRDYQVRIVNEFLKNPQSIQVAATGAGKTLVTAALSNAVESYGRSIVIVPNKSLVVQTEADYINLGLDVGVYFGDRKDAGKTHTICTWQSVLQIIKNTQAGEGDITISDFMEDVVCVICDEVHTAKSDSLKSMLSGVMSHVPIRWGLTGTVPKEKYASTALEIGIGPVINKLDAKELQDRGVLAKCHVNIIQTQETSQYKDYQSELKYLLDNEPRLDAIAKIVNEITKTGNTLVLVDRVNAGNELMARIDNSVFVSGNTKLKERSEEYKEVSVSDDKVIIATYGVAAVGLNIPRIFNLVLIEPGKSFTRVIQSIGRGLRVAEDKNEVQIYDITSACKFSKRHLSKRKEFYKDAQYPYTQEKFNY